ncbi:MAG: hypothetical protein ABIU29_12280 [Chthoniobacterales bacterium]
MANEVSRYLMGDVYAGDIGIGFLVADSREDAADPTIDGATARAIVAASDGDPNVTLSPINLFEISPEEFELYRGAEVTAPDLPDGLALFQVKR